MWKHSSESLSYDFCIFYLFLSLGGRFGYFSFCSARGGPGGGKGESEALGGGRVVDFLLEFPGGVYQHDASRCTNIVGYVLMAFGDAQVDLALAEIKRASPFLAESKPLDKCSSESRCISTSDPTFLGRLLGDRHLDDSLLW